MAAFERRRRASAELPEAVRRHPGSQHELNPAHGLLLEQTRHLVAVRAFPARAQQPLHVEAAAGFPCECGRRFTPTGGWVRCACGQPSPPCRMRVGAQRKSSRQAEREMKYVIEFGPQIVAKSTIFSSRGLCPRTPGASAGAGSKKLKTRNQHRLDHPDRGQSL